jgi:phosphoserine phosphatase RsbU/P
MALPNEESEFFGALLDDDPEELYDNAPCAYLSTLPDGMIVKVNQTFLSWTGHDRAGLVGVRRLQDLFAPGDRIFYETHYAPALHIQGRIREIAVEIVTASGARLPVLVNAVLTTDDVGAPLRVRTAIFDARERRAYETELLTARRRAEDSEARARALATTLQSTLLPPGRPTIPGLDVAGVYRPSGDGSEVGGDFYDVFETGLGTWGVIVGDVCGKGPAAAALTAVARYTARAEAARSRSPAAVLRGTHDAMLRHDPDRFCTAALLMLQPSDGGWDATLARAGHPPPLRGRVGSPVEPLGTPGSVLGMVSDHRTTDTSLVLAPGDRVVLYTDGVTEARIDGALFGEERLADVVRRTAGDGVSDAAEAIVTAALDFQEQQARDDIAVVVLEVPAPGAAEGGER